MGSMLIAPFTYSVESVNANAIPRRTKSTQGIATLLCEAQHNAVYLIMVVMRRTDVKTAPGEDSWRSCFT